MPKSRPLPTVNRVDFYRLKEFDFVALIGNSISSFAADPKARGSAAQIAVAVWVKMCIDVPNGGFTQFFYNHGGDAGCDKVAEMLDELGESKLAAVIRDAQAVYRQNRKAFAVDNPWEGLFGSIKAFEKLDVAFGQAMPRATQGIEKFVRANIGQLAVGDDGQPIDPAFTGEVEVKQPNGKIGQFLQVKKGKAHGVYREHFKDGTPRAAVFYQSGQIAAGFWPNGQVRKKETKQGKLTVVEWFYESGKLQKRFVRDKNGFAAEPVRLYHENGQLAEELHMSAGREHGPWLRFFEDGSPKLEAENVDGQPKVKNAWDDDRKQVVKNGTGTFYKDGRSISPSHQVLSQSDWTSVSELKNGQYHGKVTKYWEGVLWSTDEYRNGKRDGKSILYWDNGRPHAITTYADNRKQGEATEFPKFDEPVPAVIVSVQADADLYQMWRHIPVDEYPKPLNLEAIQRKVKIPQFLKDVHERNLADAIADDYEDANRFTDGIAYFLTVSDRGKVTDARANAGGVYSRNDWDTYLPLLKQLRFSPGRIGGNPVECQVLARVDHTFVEGKTKLEG